MTEPVKFYINAHNHGKFYITENNQQLGEMTFSISGGDMTVRHTEVIPEAEGKGFAKQLFDAMVNYVRGHQLGLVALCPYVRVQLKRHRDQYADIWRNPDPQ